MKDSIAYSDLIAKLLVTVIMLVISLAWQPGPVQAATFETALTQVGPAQDESPATAADAILVNRFDPASGQMTVEVITR